MMHGWSWREIIPQMAANENLRQNRLYDYQFSLTTTPVEFEQAYQAFMELSNTTAHQGLLKDKFAPPIPIVVLGEAKGRLYTPEELIRKFSGFVTNFTQEVVKRQLPLSVEGIRRPWSRTVRPQ